MFITVSWDIPEKNILLIELEGQLRWTDLETALDHGFDVIRDLPNTVHVIVDLRRTAKLPSDSPLPSIHKVFSKAPQNAGNSVFIFNQQASTLMSKVLFTGTLRATRGAAGRVSVANSLENARALLLTRYTVNMAYQAMT
jgi:hypothetical protein